MQHRLQRSIASPIREYLTTHDRWLGPDRGLIACWERGRQKRVQEPSLAARAERGELVPLAWVGGVEKKSAAGVRRGSFHYLATWQGLRGEDLDIAVDGARWVTCSKSGQVVEFATRLQKTEG